MASTEEPTGTTEAANTTDITDTGMPSVAPSEGATDPTPVPAKRAPRKRAASRAPKRATNGEEGPTEAGEVQLADGDQAHPAKMAVEGRVENRATKEAFLHDAFVE